jgi:hypothetical protein
MKKLADLLVVASFLLVIYCTVFKLAGQPVIYLGFMKVSTISGLIAAVFLMQVSIWLKLSNKG